ncbi:hypothetical protein AADS67_004543 [Escherichia coli]
MQILSSLVRVLLLRVVMCQSLAARYLFLPRFSATIFLTIAADTHRVELADLAA